MSRTVIIGAGAFGTALAIAMSRRNHKITLVGRDVATLQKERVSPRLPNIALPDQIEITDTPLLTASDLLLMAIPTQMLTSYLEGHPLTPKAAIACCKGIDLKTGSGPTTIMERVLGVPSAVLTGPSFAFDIARGLPTALTLATEDQALGAELQQALSTETLRLYLSDDPKGAELGGALKNVIAIACGICIGAGLGESARAALMTRGYAEMVRMAQQLGGKAETLAGLSGFGDLALTCTSEQSRNFCFGLSLGRQKDAPQATIEGRSTAQAVVNLAADHSVEMPIAQAVAGMIDGTLNLNEALEKLLSRPLRKE